MNASELNKIAKESQSRQTKILKKPFQIEFVLGVLAAEAKKGYFSTAIDKKVGFSNSWGILPCDWLETRDYLHSLGYKTEELPTNEYLISWE